MSNIRKDGGDTAHTHIYIYRYIYVSKTRETKERTDKPTKAVERKERASQLDVRRTTK